MDVLFSDKMPPKKAEEPEKKPLIGRVGTNLKVGIVGIPNVGKSTFFNVLTKSQAAAENFPFCTIDPNENKYFYIFCILFLCYIQTNQTFFQHVGYQFQTNASIIFANFTNLQGNLCVLSTSKHSQIYNIIQYS